MDSNKLKPPATGVQGRGKPPAASKKGKDQKRPKQKKAAASHKQTQANRDMPKVSNDIGNSVSNAQADAVSKLVAAGQVSSMSGTSSTFAVTDFLANSLVYAVGIDLVHKLCAARPCDCSTADTTSAWTPAGAMSYLVWALFDALRKGGAFQNPAMVNAFPEFPPDGDIPVAWAQVLSHIKPFKQGTVSCAFDDNTLTSLPTIPSSSRVGLGGSSFTNGGRTTSAYYPLGTSGQENVLTAGTGPTSWANVYTCQPFLSNIWSTLSCTKYALVPDLAPDASAYAVPSLQSAGAFVCVSPTFAPEMTTVIGIGGAAGQAYGSTMAYYKTTPALNGSNSAQFWFVENFQLCPFIPGANLKKTLQQHAWNDAKFCDRVSPTGRVYVTKRKDRAPIRFLFGNTIPIDTRCFQAMIGQVLSVMNPVGQYTSAQVYAFGVVVMSALIAKLMPYCYATTQAAVGICTAFDPAFASLSLPPPLAVIINTLGPIAVDGRIWYPSPWQNTEARGTWISWSTVGLVSSAAQFFRFIVGGADVNAITIGNFTFSAANFASPSTNPMTPVTSTPAFIGVYQNIFNASATTSENTSNLIKLDSHNPVGKANQLVMADVVVSGAATNNANYPTLTAGPLRVNEVIVSSVASYKCVMGDELGAAIVCPLVLPVNNAGSISTIAAVNPPFRAPIGGLNRISGVSSFVEAAMTEEVGQALATALGMMKRQAIAVNGNTIDVSANGDLFGAILDKVVAPILGDGVAQGIKGSPFAGPMRHLLPWMIPGIGGAPLYMADRMGITDGILSTFANGKQRVAKPPETYAKGFVFPKGLAEGILAAV